MNLPCCSYTSECTQVASIAAIETDSSIQQRYVEVSDDDDGDLLKHLDIKATEKRNSATSAPLESFGPIDDRSGGQVFVPSWKAYFQQLRHWVEVEVEGDVSVHFESVQTADGGLMRKRMLARLR
ncbi:hypothetical protein JG688_00015557 [Phytophthora aleatoria]|uniref:Uncharacterized protein n=1 Tax=Phytophthora aleatoria TaxID=2496075 RepID=A0A8J5M2M2_9STRA|nr:hypothetical protein JG688_00015557 [Phytophthora aleatoria]